MGTGDRMGLLESLSLSGIGFLVVFSVLVILAVAILIFSRIFTAINRDKKQPDPPAAPPPPAPPVDNGEDEIFAVLLAAVSEQEKIPMDRFRIVEIREV